MARDFDFRSRRVLKPAKAALRKTNQKSNLRLVLLVIIGLLGGIYWLLAGDTDADSYSRIDRNQHQNRITSNDVEKRIERTATADATKATLTVQLYDSGAGKEVADKVKNELESLGYKVKDLGKSQFDYETTFIWHRENRQKEAEELAQFLKDRQVSLRQSKIGGVFEVLIFLGRQ